MAPDRVLVTGGSGFLGAFVVGELRQQGHDVVALARSATAASKLEQAGATPIFGDLDDPASVDGAFASAEAEALVNLASLGFGHAPTIVHAAEDAGIERAVFVSTTAIFTSLDAASKSVRTAAEETIRTSKLRWTIIRPTMIYGTPGDRNMWRLLQLLRRTPVVPLPGAENVHQPVHVADLADAIVAASKKPQAVGREYDVAGPEAITLRAIVDAAASAVGRRVRVMPVPASPLISAVGAVERSGRRLPISAEQIARLTEDKAFDISPARRDLGYDPRPFARGIAEEAAMTP